MLPKNISTSWPSMKYNYVMTLKEDIFSQIVFFNARGKLETLFLGSETMEKIIKSIFLALTL